MSEGSEIKKEEEEKVHFSFGDGAFGTGAGGEERCMECYDRCMPCGRHRDDDDE